MYQKNFMKDDYFTKQQQKVMAVNSRKAFP